MAKPIDSNNDIIKDYLPLCNPTIVNTVGSITYERGKGAITSSSINKNVGTITIQTGKVAGATTVNWTTLIEISMNSVPQESDPGYYTVNWNNVQNYLKIIFSFSNNGTTTLNSNISFALGTYTSSNCLNFRVNNIRSSSGSIIVDNLVLVQTTSGITGDYTWTGIYSPIAYAGDLPSQQGNIQITDRDIRHETIKYSTAYSHGSSSGLGFVETEYLRSVSQSGNFQEVDNEIWTVPLRQYPSQSYTEGQSIRYSDLSWDNSEIYEEYSDLSVIMGSTSTRTVHIDWRYASPLLAVLNADAHLGSIRFKYKQYKSSADSSTSDTWHYATVYNEVKDVVDNQAFLWLYISTSDYANFKPGVCKGDLEFEDLKNNTTITIYNIVVDVWFSAHIFTIGQYVNNKTRCQIHLRSTNNTAEHGNKLPGWDIANYGNGYPYITDVWWYENDVGILHQTYDGGIVDNNTISSNIFIWEKNGQITSGNSVYVYIITSDGIRQRSAYQISTNQYIPSHGGGYGRPPAQITDSSDPCLHYTTGGDHGPGIMFNGAGSGFNWDQSEGDDQSNSNTCWTGLALTYKVYNPTDQPGPQYTCQVHYTTIECDLAEAYTAQFYATYEPC